MVSMISISNAGYKCIKTDRFYTGLVLDYSRNIKETKDKYQFEKNNNAISLLYSWLKDTNKDNIAEQTKSLTLLKETLDEDRQSYRKLFHD